MATSFGALCSDFYINQKLSLKLDLPGDRETVLHLFDQVRKRKPRMDRFRRFEGELALESDRNEEECLWLALRRTSLRTGHVNPRTMAAGFGLHRMILELAPPYLSLSPLDVDHLEIMFGFDLEFEGNQDEVVMNALFPDTPLAGLLAFENAQPLDVQPIFGASLSESGDLQAYFEVKTRRKGRRGQPRDMGEPISLFVTLRQYGPFQDLAELPATMETLGDRAEELASERLVPDLLQPIAARIASSQE